MDGLHGVGAPSAAVTVVSGGDTAPRRVELASGRVSVGRLAGEPNVTVTGAPGQLAPGVYVRVLTVTAANSNNGQTITVVLTVQ